MTGFFLGAAIGFGAAWMLWENRWFCYSLRKGIEVEDIWKEPK